MTHTVCQSVLPKIHSSSTLQTLPAALHTLAVAQLLLFPFLLCFFCWFLLMENITNHLSVSEMNPHPLRLFPLLSLGDLIQSHDFRYYIWYLLLTLIFLSMIHTSSPFYLQIICAYFIFAYFYIFCSILVLYSVLNYLNYRFSCVHMS